MQQVSKSRIGALRCADRLQLLLLPQFDVIDSIVCPVAIVLVGNKIDLKGAHGEGEGKKREVTPAHARARARARARTHAHAHAHAHMCVCIVSARARARAHVRRPRV